MLGIGLCHDCEVAGQPFGGDGERALCAAPFVGGEGLLVTFLIVCVVQPDFQRDSGRGAFLPGFVALEYGDDEIHRVPGAV